MTIDTSHYRAAHGKEPRGVGTWAFCKVSPERADYMKHLIWCNGPYAVARKNATQVAKKSGIDTLYVCS